MITAYLADALSGTPDAGQLSTASIILLVVAVGMALAFEFVNGFHDTANAVATVIYTNTMKPWFAVIWSGCFNLLGVLFSSGAVAYAIMSLLPADMVTHISSGAGFAMVFSILISAIVWNLGTWYLGLPASSSHTLVGAIVGVGLAYSMMAPDHAFGDGVNWKELTKIFLSLLISPMFGFVGASLLLLVSRKLIKWDALYKAPTPGVPPPASVRALLIATCTGVSFFHGRNDGQKGMGLVLLILIGVMPATYAMNLNTSTDDLQKMQQSAALLDTTLVSAKARPVMADGAANQELTNYLKENDNFGPNTLPAVAAVAHDVSVRLGQAKSLGEMPVTEREILRNELYLCSSVIGNLSAKKMVDSGKIDDRQQKLLVQFKKNCSDPATHNIPFWVKLATAFSLGLGTMIGWKRIVVTVGEKIGKNHLTYAQGAAAELMAAATIGAADGMGLPVSTTHVLSSGIAGTMVANGSGVQMSTIRNIAVAWLLTVPACVLIGAGLFAAALEVTIYHLVPVAAGAAVVAVILTILWRLRKFAAQRGGGGSTGRAAPQPG